LRFASREPRQLDRSTVFRLGEGLYTAYLPFGGPLHLLAPGVAGVAGENNANYHPFAADAWVVDLLVTGQSGSAPVSGTSAETDRAVSGLTAATAISAFAGGTSPGRLQELARQVRNNFHSRTPVSRGGATNMVAQRFPEITATAAVVSGDYEMTRDVVNPGQVAAGCLDLLVRSPTLLRDTVELELDWMSLEDPQLHAYCGWLALPETPIRITSIAHAGVVLPHQLFSVSTDPRKPGLSAAYGTAERLFVRIPQALDVLGNPVVTQLLDGNRIYGRFSVTYDFDPNLKAVQAFVAGEENVPVGLDLYTRWFTPLEITRLQVDYNRKAGVSLKLAQARADILQAYNTHTHDNPATPALIADALFYANAHSVAAVRMTGDIRFSVAGSVWLGTELVVPADSDTWADFLADCVAVPVRAVTSAYEPEIRFLDLTTGTFAASGARSVSWLLESINLELIELRSV
jgi:hypothetical protein